LIKLAQKNGKTAQLATLLRRFDDVTGVAKTDILRLAIELNGSKNICTAEDITSQ